jgi:uncharacterized tellurite resistance protein B-like protein
VVFESITLVYLACARLGDGQLDPSETRMIVEKLRQLCPEVEEADGKEAFRRTAARFFELHRQRPVTIREAVLTAAQNLAELEESRRVQIVRALVEVTDADGKVSDGEFRYLHGVADKLGIDL